MFYCITYYRCENSVENRKHIQITRKDIKIHKYRKIFHFNCTDIFSFRDVEFYKQLQPLMETVLINWICDILLLTGTTLLESILAMSIHKGP